MCSRWQEDAYAYVHPAEVREILPPLPYTFEILEDYLPNDFTVICRKNPLEQ